VITGRPPMSYILLVAMGGRCDDALSLGSKSYLRNILKEYFLLYTQLSPW